MPPKPTGKKGDNEDFSDAATLPQANVFKFTLVQKSFLSLENRDKVRQALKDKFVPTSMDKIKTLSRDEIVTYGKSKSYILDAAQIAALPQEDPRKQLSEHDMVARSAADRIFEITVQIRRQKATRPPPGDEDEKKLQEEQVDGSIYLLDYPQTRAEILAFSKYSQSLNTVFEIEEVFTPPEINDEEDQQVTQVDAQVQTTPDSEDQRAAATQIIQAFKSARQDSDIRSPLRNLAVLRVAFRNVVQSIIVSEVDGSSSEKNRSAEDSFVADLVAKNVDKYAQYYFQYLKFKRTVETLPLVPDQVVKNKLQRLSVDYEKDRRSVESLREHSKSLIQGDEEYQRAQQEIAHLESKMSERMSMSKDLTRRSKKSLDDEESTDFDRRAYDNDFVRNSETANKISSVLSAMVTHIEHVNKEVHDHSKLERTSPTQKIVNIEPSTADESVLSDIFDRFATEIACDLSLMSRGQDPEDAPNPSDSISQKHNNGILIHDETNRTLEVKQTAPLSILESDQNRLNQIGERESQVYANLQVPGKNRHWMPPIPTQSKRLRDAENPEFYPFCTLPVDQAERLMCLRAFQQMLRSKGIDEGKSGLAKHTKYQVFERCFENHMTKEIFAQVLADGLLDDPDIAQSYYPRTDAILLALYNRRQRPNTDEFKKFQVVSQDELLPANPEEIDYQRQWRAKYRVMPDFENWLAFFADEVIQESEIPRPVKKEEVPAPIDPVPAGKAPGKGQAPAADIIDPNAIPTTFMRYQLDEELLPKQLYSVEDAKIQSVAEKSAFLYPDDNSVMRVDHYQVGGLQFKKSIVIKDNLKFGLRESKEAPSFQVRSDEDYGLVRQVACGDTEFFLHFENGTKLGVEHIKMERNPQRTIKIPARQMTAEEKAYQNEQKAKLQAATEKAIKANKPPPTDIDIPKDPEPTWEQEHLSYFDMLFEDEEISQSHARSTLTFKNGLIVQFLGSGHIYQIQEKSLSQKSGEVNRIVTKEGVVIRQMANRDAEMMFPDGVRAFFSKQNLEWIVTNNKGMQRALKDGVFRDLKPIPCAKETDSITGARMMIREDEVIAVTYKDGSLFCQHRDGTKFHTSADGNEIIVEKFGFASHIIRQTDARVSGKNDPFGRALDGRVVETFLPDGTKTQTFIDTFQSKKDEIQLYRTLITRQDLSVVLCDSEGHVSVISSNTRAALNEQGEKSKLGVRDVDYLEELARHQGQFIPQVYQAHVNRQPLKSQIKTKNFTDDTQFVLKSDLTLLKRVQVSTRKSGQVSEKEKNRQKRKLAKAVSYVADELAGNRIMDIEIEETGGYQEPNLKYYTLPRLFVVNNDGSAKELLSHLQLEYALRTKGLQSDKSMMMKMQDVFNHQFVENTFFLTKVISMAQVQVNQQTLNKIDLPDNAKEVLQEKAVEQDYTLMLPKQDQYLFSQVFKMPEADSFSQTAFANDYERFVQWKMEQVRYDSEFGIIHAPTSKDAKVDWEKIEDDNFQNKRIAIKILKQRAQPRDQFKSELFKTQAIKEMHASETVKAFRESGQTSTFGSLQSSTDKPGFSKKTAVKVMSQLEREPQLKNSQPKAKASIKPNQNAQQQKERVDRKLNDLQQLKVASDFIPEYFQSDVGQDFISKNPQKPPSEEVLTRMKQRLERMNKSQMQNMQGETDYEGENQQSSQPEETRDNPIVALEPDELKQGSHFTGSKRNDKSQIQGDGTLARDSNQDPVIYPSLYMQEKMYILQKEQETLLKSEEHHIVKTKDFNVYGRLREEKPFVKTIQKSNAQSDLNEKFITTECITDRRVKISSQAPRFYMNAPSVEDVRKQGQHQMILGAIEKKQTFSELINQANSMVTGVLHDTLKRSINVMPSTVVFGSIRTGTVNEILMTLKNEDQIAHRIMIKPVSDKRVVVKQLEYGIIAPGMIKQISVSIRVSEDETDVPSHIEDTIQIVTKHDVFKIPVSAQILAASEFEEANDQNLQQTGKPIQNSRVRERLLTKIADSKEASGPVVLTSLPLSQTQSKN